MVTESYISPALFIDIVLNRLEQSKKISNDQELIQSDPTSCPQNQKGNSQRLLS